MICLSQEAYENAFGADLQVKGELDFAIYTDRTLGSGSYLAYAKYCDSEAANA